jgi:hypothetical protein
MAVRGELEIWSKHSPQDSFRMMRLNGYLLLIMEAS